MSNSFAFVSFKGRIRRSRFWATNIAISLALLAKELLAEELLGPIFTFIIIIPAIWFTFDNCVKRLHDLGKSGWWVWLLLVPIVNIVLFIYLAFFKGQECDNRFGPNPYDE